MRDLRKHDRYYISLIIIFAFGVFLANQFTGFKQVQIGIAVTLSVFYVFWGALHHVLEHDLTPKIMIEYVLMGCVGLAVLLFLIQGGLGT